MLSPYVDIITQQELNTMPSSWLAYSNDKPEYMMDMMMKRVADAIASLQYYTEKVDLKYHEKWPDQMLKPYCLKAFMAALYFHAKDGEYLGEQNDDKTFEEILTLHDNFVHCKQFEYHYEQSVYKLKKNYPCIGLMTNPRIQKIFRARLNYKLAQMHGAIEGFKKGFQIGRDIRGV